MGFQWNLSYSHNIPFFYSEKTHIQYYFPFLNMKQLVPSFFNFCAFMKQIVSGAALMFIVSPKMIELPSLVSTGYC